MDNVLISELVIFNNNIAIAKFLGWKYRSADENWKISKVKKDTWTDLNNLGHYNLLFHYSWEWLMPVVDKIEKMGYNFSARFNHDANGEGLGTHYAFFAYRDYQGEPPRLPFHSIVKGDISTGGGVYSSDNSKLESIYLAVVGFIDFHNQKKEH